MKHILSIILLAGCVTTTQAQKRTTVAHKNKQQTLQATKFKEEKEDIFGRQLFDLLQSGDQQSWRKIFPNFEEYQSLIEQALAANMFELTRQRVDSLKLIFKRDADSAYRNDLVQLQQEARVLGIQWKDASFTKFDWVASYPDDFPARCLGGDIYFYFGNNTFIAEGIEAIEYSGRYKLQSIKRITKLH
jgi:hypothetical protein